MKTKRLIQRAMNESPMRSHTQPVCSRLRAARVARVACQATLYALFNKQLSAYLARGSM